jgi:thiaminase
MLYDTERSLKAPNQTEYKGLTDKIADDAHYSNGMLETCTGPLELNGTKVLQTPLEKAIEDYAKFAVGAADTYDWVVSLVAMIPCIQVSSPTRTLTDHSKDGNKLS